MLNNSTENLFGGINKIIAEKYAKMHLNESTETFNEGDKVKIKDSYRGKYSDDFCDQVHTFSGKAIKRQGVEYSHLNKGKQSETTIPTRELEKLEESASVSDVDQTPKKGETQLDETGCADKKIEESTEIVQESQDYNTFLKREDFDSKLNELGLKAEHNGKDHDEVKDTSGDLKGWWNGHTGVGYLRKDCCKPVTESVDQQQEPTTHTESGDFTTDESLKIAIQTAANRAKESGTHYHDEIIRELGSLGVDPMRHSTHTKLDNAVSSMTNGKYTCHSDFGNDHVAGQLKEEVTLETPVVESILIPTDKLEESPIISRNGAELGGEVQNIKEDNLEENYREAGKNGFYITSPSLPLKVDLNNETDWYEPGTGDKFQGHIEAISGNTVKIRNKATSELHTFKKASQDDYKNRLQEAHLTPELMDKIEEYVHKLKPKMSEFQDKYGDSAQSVMYGTATKLAKNDLGIKD